MQAEIDPVAGRESRKQEQALKRRPERSQERSQELQRRRVAPQSEDYRPAYVVWELTLRCDHACLHCGSRAAKARAEELSRSEALSVVAQLAEMGAQEVVLIGGEAYLHPDFLEIIQALSQAGITPVMTSGGMGIDARRAQDMAAAGLKRVSISIDGLAENHNQIRKRPDSFERALQALDALQAAGLDISANTHFNRLNQADLEPLYEVLKQAGVRSWQIQITAALGRAADQEHFLFQPYDLLHFVPRVAALKRRGLQEGLLIMPGNNLGYFGPEEALLRSPYAEGTDHFQGCQAGKFVLGIESEGQVKGCPSLQSAAYVGGSLRKTSLKEIWEQSPELAFRRKEIALWGHCQSCVFAESCGGGCSFTAHALFGRPGNNPYCHFRALQLSKKGRRERLVKRSPAPGLPFDHGEFELIEEALDAPDPGAGERALKML